jgi:hypothetical protein
MVETLKTLKRPFHKSNKWGETGASIRKNLLYYHIQSKNKQKEIDLERKKQIILAK